MYVYLLFAVVCFFSDTNIRSGIEMSYVFFKQVTYKSAMAVKVVRLQGGLNKIKQHCVRNKHQIKMEGSK